MPPFPPKPRPALTLVVALLAAALASAQLVLADLLDRASRCVQTYESSFSVLALDEEYVQWLERPTNPGTNLSRTNATSNESRTGNRCGRRRSATPLPNSEAPATHASA